MDHDNYRIHYHFHSYRTLGDSFQNMDIDCLDIHLVPNYIQIGSFDRRCKPQYSLGR